MLASQPKSLLDLSDASILDLAHKIRLGYQMKRTMRYKTVRDNSTHNESVAEHVFGLGYLAPYFLHYDDPDGKLDQVKIHGIIQFHDFGEIPKGDQLFCRKSQANERIEFEGAMSVFGALPEPLCSLGKSFWLEYRDRKTPEAKFVYALDKIEPAFELLDRVNEQSQKRNKVTYEDYVRKYPAIEPYPHMYRFGMAIGMDMKNRGIFYVKPA